MMSNKKIIFIAILISLLLVFIINSYVKQQKQETCKGLENEIYSLLEQANYCNADSDCKINREFPCPFGCTRLVNINADLEEIRIKILAYNEKCGRCEVDCDVTPKQEQVKCRNSKCIDIRYDNW